jgi:hypothetical protein
MKASLAEQEVHRWLHPHPRVTAVAKKTATAAPLALSRNQAGEGSSESPQTEEFLRNSLSAVSTPLPDRGAERSALRSTATAERELRSYGSPAPNSHGATGQ